MSDKSLRYPFGPADVQAQKPYAAAISATIKNSETILPIAQMTGGATLNLEITSGIGAGAVLTVKVSADGTNRTFTPGTGMTGVAQTITANQSFTLTYKHDGTTFQHVGTQRTV